MKTKGTTLLTTCRDLLCNSFSLTRTETASLLLVMGILLIGLAAKMVLR